MILEMILGTEEKNMVIFGNFECGGKNHGI